MAKRNDFSVIDAAPKEFCFKLKGSDELRRLPSVGSLPVRVARKLMDVGNGSNAEVLDAVGDLMDQWCPGLVDSLTLEQFTEVVEAWFTASGITMGESSASAD